MKTNDQTTVNASRAILGHREIDEDSILKEFGSLAPTRKLPKASNNSIMPNSDMMLNSGDFDVSQSLSPGKLDRHLEKIMNDQ